MPNIRVDQDVYKLLQKQAEPFVDTPNAVLRRMLGLDSLVDERTQGGQELNNGSAGITRADSKGRSPSIRKKKQGRSRKKSRERAKPGSVLPLEEYLPIVVDVLADRGGAAPAREVITEVGERLKGRLTQTDHQTISSGEIRWQNRVQFARLRLVEEGFLTKDSPKGVWTLSDAGRGQAKKDLANV